MDLARAGDELDRLIERRAKQAAVEDLWEASVKKDKERKRRQRRGEWFCYWSALADSLRKSADEFEAKAQALLEDGNERRDA